MCTQSVRFEPSTSDFQQERDCKFTCKFLCCKCSFCYRVAAKKRCKSKLLSQLHRNKICERCFLCRSLELCKSNVPTAAIDLPVGARLHQVWEKWEALGVSPKVVTTHREGYTLPFQFRPNLTRSPTVVSSYINPHKNLNLLEALYQLVNKNAVEPLGNLHRFQRRILPHTNSQSVQEVHAFSCPGSLLPIQSPTLWPVHSTHGDHSGGQRGQTDGFTEGYKNPPVPR